MSTALASLRSWLVTQRDQLAAYGALVPADKLLDSVLVQLDEVLREADDEILSLAEAADASGYSVDHLARLVRTGRIENAGRSHAPRIRRRDLPHRAGFLPPQPSIAIVGTSRRQIARAVVNSEQGAHDD